MPPRNHDVRLIALLRQNLTVEEALIIVAHEAGLPTSINWTLLGIKRMEFMRPIVRGFDEYGHREWDEPLVVPE
jgi:hypothetical protein